MNKTKVMLGLLLAISCSLQAQWLDVTHFPATINKILHKGDTMIAVATNEVYYAPKPYESWQKVEMPGYTGFKIIQTNEGFGFVSNGNLYKFSYEGIHRKVSEIYPQGILLSGGDGVLNIKCSCGYGQSEILVDKFNINTGAKQTYNLGTYTFYFSTISAAANDSILLMEVRSNPYSKGPYGTDVINLKTLTRKAISNPNVIWGEDYLSLNVYQSEISSLMKAYDVRTFHYSNDYGKTNIFNKLHYSMVLSSPITKVANGESFIINLDNTNPGTNVWYSDNLGSNWHSMLTDSVLTDAEIIDNSLYVLTKNNHLLKLSFQILGLEVTSESTTNNIIYADGRIVNMSGSRKKMKIYDLKGQIWLEEELDALQSRKIELPKGFYILVDADTGTKLKITIV